MNQRASDYQSAAEAFARLGAAFGASAESVGRALGEWQRVYTEALARIPFDQPDHGVWAEPADPGCRACGGTIEDGCCTRCGVPKETR